MICGFNIVASTQIDPSWWIPVFVAYGLPHDIHDIHDIHSPTVLQLQKSIKINALGNICASYYICFAGFCWIVYPLVI